MFLFERFIFSKTGVYGIRCRVNQVDTYASADTLEKIKKGFNIDKFGSFQHPAARLRAKTGFETSPHSLHIQCSSAQPRDVSNVGSMRKGKRKECLAFPARTSANDAERVRSQPRGQRFGSHLPLLLKKNSDGALIEALPEVLLASFSEHVSAPSPTCARAAAPSDQRVGTPSRKRRNRLERKNFPLVRPCVSSAPGLASTTCGPALSLSAWMGAIDSDAFPRAYQLSEPLEVFGRQLTSKWRFQPMYSEEEASVLGSHVISMGILSQHLRKAAQPLHLWMGEGWDDRGYARSCGVEGVPGEVDRGRRP